MKRIKILIIILLLESFSCSTIKVFPSAINQLDNDRKTGVWVVKNDTTDRVTIQYYSQNIKDGDFIEYHANGKTAIAGCYKNGKKNGMWKIYTEIGTLASELKYQNGKLLRNKVYNLKW